MRSSAWLLLACVNALLSTSLVKPLAPAFTFEFVKVIASNTTGNLRDPSSAVRAPDGSWHFWTDYVPGTYEPGWGAFLYHYHSWSIFGPWEFSDLAFQHNPNASAWGSYGSFSSSVIYDEDVKLWYIFYSATANATYQKDQTSAQLAASASSPYGPWTQLGAVATPTGTGPDWDQAWNARRLDSGRALIIDGVKTYYTKGVKGKNYAQEGAYRSIRASSFQPPYVEVPNNPIYNANQSSDLTAGYENCEFFKGPDTRMHVLCQSHGKGQLHFTCKTSDCLAWTRLADVDTSPALEPTPVYEGVPGDQADVSHFIARMEYEVQGIKRLVIGLFNITWR